jgi:hypothetical protein
MKPPLAIAFIALLFSGCSAQVQQNRVCRAKIKQTKALLSELVPQDTIDGRVCMLRPMEDELRLVVRDNEACFSNRNIQEFLCDFEGHVNHKKKPDNGTEYYQIAIWQCYADSVRHGFIVLTFSADKLGVISRVSFNPAADGRAKIVRTQSHHHKLQNKHD